MHTHLKEFQYFSFIELRTPSSNKIRLLSRKKKKKIFYARRIDACKIVKNPIAILFRKRYTPNHGILQLLSYLFRVILLQSSFTGGKGQLEGEKRNFLAPKHRHGTSVFTLFLPVPFSNRSSSLWWIRGLSRKLLNQIVRNEISHFIDIPAGTCNLWRRVDG